MSSVVINTESILASLLKNKRIEIQHLKKMSKKLRKINPEIYIDISFDSICFVVDENPDIFSWEDESIVIHSNKYQKTFEERFNKTLPNEIRRLLVETF